MENKEVKFNALLKIYSELDKCARDLDLDLDRTKDELKVATDAFFQLQADLDLMLSSLSEQELEEYYAWLPF